MSARNGNVILRRHKPMIVNSCFLACQKTTAGRRKYTANIRMRLVSLAPTNEMKHRCQTAIIAV